MTNSLRFQFPALYPIGYCLGLVVWIRHVAEYVSDNIFELHHRLGIRRTFPFWQLIEEVADFIKTVPIDEGVPIDKLASRSAFDGFGKLLVITYVVHLDQQSIADAQELRDSKLVGKGTQVSDLLFLSL